MSETTIVRPLAWWRRSTLPECLPCVTTCADEAQQWREEGHEVRELGDVGAERERLLREAPTRSRSLADAGFTRRPSLRAMEMCAALELIAAPRRPDGTWNRDREACRSLAAEALRRYDDGNAPNPAVDTRR